MIDADVLRKLGWSDDLIKAVVEAAEPMRGTPGTEIDVPTAIVHSTSGSVIYSDVVINNTARAFTVQEPVDASPTPAASGARSKKKKKKKKK